MSEIKVKFWAGRIKPDTFQDDTARLMWSIATSMPEIEYHVFAIPKTRKGNQPAATIHEIEEYLQNKYEEYLPKLSGSAITMQEIENAMVTAWALTPERAKELMDQALKEIQTNPKTGETNFKTL